MKTPAKDLKITQEQQTFLAQHVKVWKKYLKEDIRIKALVRLSMGQMIVDQAVPKAIRESIETLITLAFQAGYEQKEKELAQEQPTVYEFSIEE